MQGLLCIPFDGYAGILVKPEQLADVASRFLRVYVHGSHELKGVRALLCTEYGSHTFEAYGTYAILHHSHGLLFSHT
ncbi:MAG: hypothetical protein WD205_01555 [Rhodothermales bacterium]